MLFLSFAMHFTYLQFLNPSLSGLLRGFFLRKAGNKMISLSETCQKYPVIKIRFKVAVLKFEFEFQAHLIRQEILRKKLWWSEKAFFSFKEFIFVRINFWDNVALCFVMLSSGDHVIQAQVNKTLSFDSLEHI